MATTRTARQRRWERWRWVIVGLAFFLLGTSRPLDSKELTASAGTAPTGLVIVAPAQAVLGENVNNQGCCRGQWADLALKVELANDGAEPVRLEQGAAEVLVDGAPHRMAQITYTVGNDPTTVVPFESYDIAPGETKTVRLLLSAFLPVAAVRSVERIELRWPAGNGTVDCTFENVNAVAATTEGMRPELWY
jgi:hypothetical protein